VTLRTLVGALLAIATPLPVLAQQPVAAAAEKQHLAAQVARITNSEEVTRIQTRKMLAETLPRNSPRWSEKARD
jgi:hypothetical protein